MNSDLYKALDAHKKIDPALLRIPEVLDNNWQHCKKFILNADPILQHDAQTRCIIAALLVYGGAGANAIASQTDQQLITQIAVRGLDRYRALLVKNPMNATIMQEVLRAAKVDQGF